MESAPQDTLRVRTADNVALGFATAGLGSRLAAQLVDGLAVGVLLVVAFAAIAAVAASLTGPQAPVLTALLFAGAFTAIVIGYFLVFELVSGGRTPGKNVLGLRVMSIDGSAPDVTSIVIRNVVRVIDYAFGIGIVVAFFHPLSRRLGDLAAGTVVVRERSKLSLAAAAAPPPIILRTPDPGPGIDGIERLGAPEYNALRIYLSRSGLAPEQRQRLAGQITTRLLARLDLPPSAPERMWPPELFLERLYLQLDQRLR